MLTVNYCVSISAFLHKCFSVKKLLNASRVMIEEIFVLLFFFRGIEGIHSPEIVFVEVFNEHPGMKAYFLLLHEQNFNITTTKFRYFIKVNTLSLKSLLL